MGEAQVPEYAASEGAAAHEPEVEVVAEPPEALEASEASDVAEPPGALEVVEPPDAMARADAVAP
jgi:hypothetical protein